MQDRRGGLSLENIAQASRTIDPVFRDSPQFEAEGLGRQLGCRLVVKIEALNPVRSFKGRGADYFVSQLRGTPHLTCATAGNFGQGMAFAARRRGLPITVFTSHGANPLKVERMRALGAQVRTAGDDPDQTHAAAKEFAAQTGALLVQDGREAAIAEGAGTIGVELLRWHEPFDAMAIPLGDGALLGGIARWVKAHSPATKMIGVCAAGSPAMHRSWHTRRVVTSDAPDTIADGIAIRTPFAESLSNLTELIDDILLVEDSAMISGMRLAMAELGLLLEPAGAAGIAALLTHGERFRDQRVATVLTGANLTPEQIREWLTPAT